MRISLATAVLALAACGGGGGGGTDTENAQVGSPGGGGSSGGTGGGSSLALVISNTQPGNYKWADLAVGMPTYIDRSYTYSNVPGSLQGLRYLQTANDDKSGSGPASTSFDVNQPVTVYVGYDSRSTALPSWLQSWSDTGLTLNTTDVNLSVFKKEFGAGTVALGGNESARSMYVLAVESDGAPQAGPLKISGSPASQATAGMAYSFVPTISGGSGNRQASISGQPSWASFNTDTGALTGTPGTGDIGSTASDIRITVQSGSESKSLSPFSIAVIASANGAATLTWTAPTTNSDNSALNGDLAGYVIYYGTSPGTYPNSKSIDNPGITSAMVENLAPGTWSFVVTALDFAGNESGYSNVATKTINAP